MEGHRPIQTPFVLHCEDAEMVLGSQIPFIDWLHAKVYNPYLKNIFTLLKNKTTWTQLCFSLDKHLSG